MTTFRGSLSEFNDLSTHRNELVFVDITFTSLPKNLVLPKSVAALVCRIQKLERYDYDYSRCDRWTRVYEDETPSSILVHKTGQTFKLVFEKEVSTQFVSLGCIVLPDTIRRIHIEASPPLTFHIPCLPESTSEIVLKGCTPLFSLPLPGVRYLTCSHCFISSLPISLLPNLFFLNCNHNSLEILELESSKLEMVHCAHNKLVFLSVIPPLLKTLWCNHNKLTHIGNLPESLTSLYVYDNPNLTSLPRLPKGLEDLQIDKECVQPRLPYSLKTFSFGYANLNDHTFIRCNAYRVLAKQITLEIEAWKRGRKRIATTLLAAWIARWWNERCFQSTFLKNEKVSL